MSINELDVLYKKLYEAFAFGRIPEDKFDLLSLAYLDEQKALEIENNQVEVLVQKIEGEDKNIDSFLSLAEKYTDFSTLTTPMINEFIDKIIVHAPDRSNGPRTQEVEVYLKFIGNFDIPQRELTPEEKAAEEERKYWQDRYWRRRDYELNRRKEEKQRKLAEKAAKAKKEHEEKVAIMLEEVRKEAEAGELSFLPKAN